MELIGLNGKKGAGKDTAGAYLVDAYGFGRISFAAPLKVSAAAALGIDPPLPETFESMKNDPNARITLMVKKPDEDDPGFYKMHTVVNITVREYLQFYGTEAHREVFGADFWTRILIDNLKPDGRYVITDARFENECGAVKEAGGQIIVIERDGSDLADTHASEAELPADLIDAVIPNNGSIEDLYTALDSYMERSGFPVADIASVA